MTLNEKLREFLDSFLKKNEGKSHNNSSQYPDFDLRKVLEGAANREKLRQVLEGLSTLEKQDTTSSVLGIKVFSHFGPDDAEIGVFLIREGATPRMVASALGGGEVNQHEFDGLKTGFWYFAKTTQGFGEPIIIQISMQPLQVIELLPKESAKILLS